MKIYRELIRNKLAFILVILVIILLILSIVLNSIVYDLRSLIQNLTAQLSIITALMLPFMIKMIERKEKDKDVENIVKSIIKRIKEYLNYFIVRKGETSLIRSRRFSGSMSFFRGISQKFPEILIKIGVEINIVEEERTFYDDMIEQKATHSISKLFILDKYILELGSPYRLILLEKHEVIKPNKKSFEDFLNMIIEHVNKSFVFKLSKNLAKLENIL